MKKILSVVAALILSKYAFACDATSEYLSEEQTVAVSRWFKEQWNVAKADIAEYMDAKYGKNRWRFNKLNHNALVHDLRPKLTIAQHRKNLQLIVLYEKIGHVNHWYEEDRGIEVFAVYKNISADIMQITLPHPDRLMAWAKLHRLWILRKFSAKDGSTELLLDETPWKFFVTNCGYGDGVVSK